MAWQDTAIQMVRIIINDLGSTLTYSDQRIEEVLVVAANLVIMELSFDNTYTINVANCTISPDPVSANDSAFVNFIVLKACCLLDQSQFRTEVLRSGIKAKLGPAILETVERLPGFKELLSVGPCASYQELKKNWTFGSGQIARFILSPFVSNDFDPSHLGRGGGNMRERLWS